MVHEARPGWGRGRRDIQVFPEAGLTRARRLISERVQRRFGASDVLNAAIRSALSEVQHGRSQVEHREDFWRLLAAVIRRKVIANARYATAKRRTVDKDEPLISDAHASSRELPPEMGAVANEVVERVEMAFAEEKDDRKYLAAMLGVVGDVEAAELRDIVGRCFPEKDKPAVRTMEYWILGMRRKAERAAKDVLGIDAEEQTIAQSEIQGEAARFAIDHGVLLVAFPGTASSRPIYHRSKRSSNSCVRSC